MAVNTLKVVQLQAGEEAEGGEKGAEEGTMVGVANGGVGEWVGGEDRGEGTKGRRDETRRWWISLSVDE